MVEHATHTAVPEEAADPGRFQEAGGGGGRQVRAESFALADLLFISFALFGWGRAALVVVELVGNRRRVLGRFCFRP